MFMSLYRVPSLIPNCIPSLRPLVFSSLLTLGCASGSSVNQPPAQQPSTISPFEEACQLAKSEYQTCMEGKTTTTERQTESGYTRHTETYAPSDPKTCAAIVKHLQDIIRGSYGKECPL